MKLPNNEVGISDIIAYRDCPARFALGMERWTEAGELPGQTNSNNAYGSCLHDAIHIVETEAVTHEEAIDRVTPKYIAWLDPEDIVRLREDLKIYETRRPIGVTLVAAEANLRVPLFDHEGETIYYRFKIDVLHRLISNPAVFVSRDYKTSRWRKTPAEVHADLQQFAYNFGIHAYFPECRHLLQVYDQLKYGELQTTKNDVQRAEMKQWLIDNVKVILTDDRFAPRQNEWCRFCPLVATCSETRRATNYWRGQLAVLAPLSKEGRKVKVDFAEEGDELERVIREDLPRMTETRKHLERVEEVLKGVLQEMPAEERARLGWRLGDRKTRSISSEGLRELHTALGDEVFYSLINLPMSALEDLVGKPKKGQPVPPELQVARDWQVEAVTGTNVVPASSED